jgi:two-component system sensor histidine kinase YesM
MFITNESGRILNFSGTTEDLKGSLWDESQAADHLVIQEHLPELNWDLIALIPADITERDTKKVRTLTIWICSICLIVFFFVGFFLSRYFSKRVSRIVLVLDAFQEGAFHKRIHFKGNDEFSRISSAFNEMGQNTEELIRKVYLTNIQKKEAEMESLQAQINPHFLYNTLSSINRLAKFGETEKLQRMVMDLAKFYRLSLNEGRTVIPVKDELEQVKAYINIQKTKFESRMNVHYDIEPEILQYNTIKLILQPFIENILEHAWCGDRIHIRIVGFLEGNTLVFKIIDDGIGMQSELLRQISDPIKSLGVGYGIRNVEQRIKLYYGDEYGISIYSKPGIGTTIRITIPTT